VVSQHRDLRGGEPIWNAEGGAFPEASAPARSMVDVVIVGAGFIGAILAATLAAAGFSVAIVDRRGPARGSTAASTALLLFEIDVPLIKLGEQIGRGEAERAWLRSFRAMQKFIATVGELSIDCDFAVRDSLYLTGNVLDAGGIVAEAEARQRIGIASRLIDGRALRKTYGIERPAALVSGNSAEADPVRLTHGFLRHALAQGAKLYFPADVVDADYSARGVTAHLDGGARIEAKHLVFATGYELPERLPRQGHRVISTWVMATESQAARLWPTQCLIWEAADPYLYLRTTADGRIVIGGEDEERGDAAYREAVLADKTQTLARKLAALLPGVNATPAFAWTGAFGKSATGLPTIGAIPGEQRCHAVLGFGGNGMTYAMIAADVIKGLIEGRPDPDGDLFAFQTAAVS
jgi:glycine/D-amino acid oxidase-like deaminating enzyme